MINLVKKSQTALVLGALTLSGCQNPPVTPVDLESRGVNTVTKVGKDNFLALFQRDATGRVDSLEVLSPVTNEFPYRLSVFLDKKNSPEIVLNEGVLSLVENKFFAIKVPTSVTVDNKSYPLTPTSDLRLTLVAGDKIVVLSTYGQETATTQPVK